MHPAGMVNSEAMSLVVLFVLVLLQRAATTKAQGRFERYLDSPLPGPDAPVLSGFDLVEYHNLEPWENGVQGSVNISYRHDNGYLYYFISEANRQTFIENPEKYLPKYGGFCAWGIAWEYKDDGWPWAPDHMGPPCGPQDGWAILDGSLYCSIWRNYQNDFNDRQKEGIRLADERWIDYYGSLTAGPQNNGCYAWNWEECFARSIYVPTNDAASPSVEILATTTTTTTCGKPGEKRQSEVPTTMEALFSSNKEDNHYAKGTEWSAEQTAMKGSVVWKWTLGNVSTTEPVLLVELSAKNLGMNEYVAFGVAEQLMQGPLVVCSYHRSTSTLTPVDSAKASVKRAGNSSGTSSSSCRTLIGNGLATRLPENDPVNATVIFSSRNETHFTVQFTASLFGIWPTPRLPARVLFAKGVVSGHGDPLPHVNNDIGREAVAGIDFLSVVDGYVAQSLPDDIDDDNESMRPLPKRSLWNRIPNTSGSVSILSGRIQVSYELFSYNEDDNGEDTKEIVLIQLQHVDISEESYIGFGISDAVMNGLVITCVPRRHDDGSLNAECKQWNGYGTNLWPREDYNGGWSILDVSYHDGAYVNYTIAGRVQDVVHSHCGNGPLLADHVRAICAVGRSPLDSGLPMLHNPGDNEAFQLKGLATSIDSHASSTIPFFGRDGLSFVCMLFLPITMIVASNTLLTY